jgi:putative ABC transport system permease protein
MAGDPPMELTSGRWPTATDEIVLDDAAAENGDYTLGDQVKLLAPFGASERSATLVGTAEFNGGGTAGATLLVFSTEAAQKLFLDGADAFNQVSLTAADGVSQGQLVAAASEVVPAGFEAVTGDQVAKESQDAVGQFLDVISTFLLVFAIIAVIVGGFIIVNTFTILVAQRSRELALLRALGAARRQVTQSVLLEAVVMSALAATIGIGLGWLLARGLAALFRAVGLDIANDALTLDATSVVISYAVGIGVTLVAAFLPARRAGKVAPVAAMRADAAPVCDSLRRRTIIGGALMVVGAVFATIGVVGGPGPDALWIGIAATIWILTAAGISSVLGRPILVACRGVFGRLFGTSGRLAGENALRDPRRTGATASALMIGLALVSTIGVLAASLNRSVDDLVDEQFTSDFLVQSTNFMPFSTTVGDDLARVDGVATVSRQQWTAARVGDSTVFVTGNDAEFDDIYDLDVTDGHQDLQGDEALVTTGFAKDHDLEVGSPLKLTFLAGKALDLRVAGIFEGTETTGDVSVPLDLLADAGVPRQDTSLSIMLDPGADPVAVGQALDDAAAPTPTVAVYDKQEFAASIRDQVNQLLYMIYGLLALAIVIAVIGIVNTLGLSVIERTREIGLLRAIGMSRPRLRRMITLESVAIAVLGAVLGMALGLVIGVLLRQSLKDNLTSLGLPLGQLLAFLVVAVVVGVLAAILPAIRASRLNVLDAIASE